MNQQAWLYLVLLGAGIAIVARMMIKRSPSSVQSPSMREMEETLDLFAADMEQENEKLLSAIAQMKQEQVQQTERLNSRIDFLEKQCYDLSHEVKRLTIQTVQLQTAHDHLLRERTSVQTSVPLVQDVAVEPPAVSLMRMKERYSELFELFEQGKSIEFIAKKMGMNKGEVNLIMQLARQEEQTRV